MKTPAGKECSYFYGDYYRGREEEECRLLLSTAPPLLWEKGFCFTCPVPDIQLANACQNLELIPSLKRKFPFGKRIISVKTSCRKTYRTGFEPKIGCGECHELPFDLPTEIGDHV